MQDRKGGPGKRKAKRKSPRPRDITLRSAGEVMITYTDAPAKPAEDKRIHPRRPMPLVPEAPTENPKEEQQDKSGSDKQDSEK